MKFQILHTNDLHNRFPERLLSQLKEPGGLILDSGDAIFGSNTAFRQCEPIFEKMKRTGYNAMAMGNREFHYLRSVLQGRFQAAGFPILSANVADLRRKLSVADSLILPLGPLKIGLFGLTAPQYPIGSFWETLTGWRFFDPLEVTREIPGRLRKSGADLIFCLSHLGLERDKQLAGTGEIHVIFGGHSHTVLQAPVWINQTAIVQGGSHGRFVGNWHLETAQEGPNLKSWSLEGGLVENP